MLKKAYFYLFVSSVLTALSSAPCWAVQPGDHVPLPDKDVTISGNGISLDEFMNSLTDVHGLLQSIDFTSSGHVSFNGKPTINGNSITIPMTYKISFIQKKLTEAGTASVQPYNGCAAGERGEQLTLTSNPVKTIRVSQTVFQLCAKAVGNTVQAHVTSYLVAGPQWMGQAVEVAGVLFQNLGAALQTQASAYGSSTGSSPAGTNTVAAQ